MGSASFCPVWLCLWMFEIIYRLSVTAVVLIFFSFSFSLHSNPPPSLLTLFICLLCSSSQRVHVGFLYLIMDDCLCLSGTTLLLKGFKITANSSRALLISCAGCGLFYSREERCIPLHHPLPMLLECLLVLSTVPLTLWLNN